MGKLLINWGITCVPLYRHAFWKVKNDTGRTMRWHIERALREYLVNHYPDQLAWAERDRIPASVSDDVVDLEREGEDS